MKPRLAYLVSQYPTTSHTFLLREIRALRASGFELLVISIRPTDRSPGALTPEEREEWNATRVVKTHPVFGVAAIQLRVFLTRPLAYLRGLATAFQMAGWDLRKLVFHMAYFAEAVVAGHWVCREGYRHLHTHFSSTVALLASRVFPLRLSMTIHGSDEFIDPEGFWMAQKVEAASLVCAISRFGRSQVMRFSHPKDWDKIQVLPLGVDTGFYSPRPFRAAPEIFEIVSVGRLAPVKGFPIMLEAVQQLERDGRRVRLRLGGGGPEQDALSAEIVKRGMTSHIYLEGSMNTEGILALYRDADIFILSSFAEGVPVVLMEAMAMQIPCVATRITGIPELIEDGVNGLLVTPSDAGELAGAIARLMDDPELRRRLGTEARLQVLERYNLKRNAAAQAEAFQRYLAAYN
jgi:colanic acid/amylovoran biosynthesis glycosyltransferase